MRKLLVKNSEWIRGEPAKGILGELQNGDFCGCIMGIDARDRGVEIEHLVGISLLTDIDADVLFDMRQGEFDGFYDDWLVECPEWGVKRHNIEENNDCNTVMKLNDQSGDADYTPFDRIKEMQPYFEARGIHLVWCPWD